MSGFYLRGALVEYGSDVLGPLPNIVCFSSTRNRWFAR